MSGSEASSSGRRGRKHPIQVVARRTGLSPDVIRVWERRYGAVSPERSAGSRRLYTEEEIERLILLRRATLAGRRIGEVAPIPTGELRELVEQDEAAAARAPRAPGDTRPAPTDRAHFEECLRAVAALDGHGLHLALSRAATELSRPALVDRVLLPLMQEIGHRWRSGELRIAHEHMATSIVRSFLGALGDDADLPPHTPMIVVTTPVGQNHELGALIAAGTAASEGWRVTYLGPNLPAEEIAAAARQNRARAVALSIVYPADDPLLGGQLRRLRELLPAESEILVGGRAAAAYRSDLDAIRAVRLDEFDGLRVELERLRSA